MPHGRGLQGDEGKRGRTTAGVLLLGVALALAGCKATGAKLAGRQTEMPLDVSSGMFDRAVVEYRLDAGRLNAPLAVTRIEGQTVSYDQVASQPLPDRASGTLRVEYPHPEGKLNMALATLTVDATNEPAAAKPEQTSWWKKFLPAGTVASSARPKLHEQWQTDITKAELDAVVAALNRQGYFEQPQLAEQAVTVSVNVGQWNDRKNWHPVPELDALMLRARGQGRLVAYQCDPSSPSSSQNWSEVYAAAEAAPQGAVPVAATAVAEENTNSALASSPAIPHVTLPTDATATGDPFAQTARAGSVLPATPVAGVYPQGVQTAVGYAPQSYPAAGYPTAVNTPAAASGGATYPAYPMATGYPTAAAAYPTAGMGAQAYPSEGTLPPGYSQAGAQPSDYPTAGDAVPAPGANPSAGYPPAGAGPMADVPTARPLYR